MNKHLIILRGVPGCGKSTLAEYISIINDSDSIKKSTICCTDDFFIKDGVYKWEASKLKLAHKWCEDKCKKAMEVGETRIIIANTNTTEKEMQPYFDMANKYGYMVFSVIVENRHGGLNKHNVPNKTLMNMVKRFNIKLI